jgi:hypothetical protein
MAARQLVTNVAEELDGLAAQIWACGLSEGARKALAVVAQMGAELALSASYLYELKRWYAGAALVRQLIEVEYLLFLFANDPNEPNRWLNATPEEARRTFSPANMRTRSDGRFSADEYSIHCELGGHPRLNAHLLLREHFTVTNRDPLEIFDPAVQWVDLAQHVERMWGHYVTAVAMHSPTNVYPERFSKIQTLFDAWRTSDPRPSQI